MAKARTVSDIFRQHLFKYDTYSCTVSAVDWRHCELSVVCSR